MKKHKHYQQIRAYADKWDIEYKESSGVWLPTICPDFGPDTFYRVVPDADGWIPWYAHEGAGCPVEGDTIVEAALNDRTGYGSCPASQRNWTEDSTITKYRIMKEEDKTFKEDKPECFNNPDAPWGGECYWQACIHHSDNEPICGSLKGTKTVAERFVQIEKTLDVLLNKMSTTDDRDYLKRRMRRIEERLNGITDTEELMASTEDFSVEATLPYAIGHVTSNDRGIYASGQGWDMINSKYLDKLLKIEEENKYE